MAVRIRPYLEYHRVEAVRAAHRAHGRITGGTVRDENGVVLCIDGLADLTKDGGSTITGDQMSVESRVRSLES
ncbi:MAG: hypothetical protein J7M39_06300 [Anaerolineae bacterium]|nr:hypothetical protein [Anaerolineae bacterium]